MAQTVTIEESKLNQILKTLNELKKEVARLTEKVESEPVYGSDEWWKWSDKKAMEDVNAGRVLGPFKSASAMIKELHKESDSL